MKNLLLLMLLCSVISYTKANPTLQIVITAGDHDSASRLEAP
jgi:hypothetical protein